ncbi:MAG: alpha/beta hydrolase [Actinomycetia bacterium]|nr:alpha/beta hydrolase [Actinomycetes bacterium]
MPGGGAPPSKPLPLTDFAPPDATESSAGNATVHLDHCRFREPTDWHVRCGWLTTPENPEKPDGEKVRLHFAVISSESENPAPDPVVYLHGGPGGGVLPWLANASDFVIEPFIADRDVIVIDQRGAGLSEPVPLCRDLSWSLADTPVAEPGADPVDAAADQLAECSEWLGENGVDLGQYNSMASARDIEDLRLALNYGPWNIYGVSYGTRLAQTLMREYPEGIRSVVLDSTYPTDTDVSVSLPGSVQRMLGTVLDACATNTTCSTDHPSLATDLEALLARSAAQPLQVPFSNSMLDASGHQEVGPGDLLTLMHGIAYTPQGISALPALIAETNAGDYSRLRRYLYDRGSYSGVIAVTFLAVQCHEEIAFSSPELLEASRTGDARYDQVDDHILGYGASAPQICAALGAGTADPVENEPVVSDLPSLVLAGAFDPITPPEWGRRVASSLTNATVIESGQASHGLVGDEGCVDRAVAAFLADPTSAVLDTCGDIREPELLGTSQPNTLPVTERVTIKGSSVNVTLDVPQTWVDEEGGDYDHLVLRARHADLWDRTAFAAVVGPELDLDAGVLGEVLGKTDELTLYFNQSGTGPENPSIAAYGLPTGDIAWYIWFEAGQDTVAIVLVGHPADTSDLFDHILVPLIDGMRIS